MASVLRGAYWRRGRPEGRGVEASGPISATSASRHSRDSPGKRLAGDSGLLGAAGEEPVGLVDRSALGP